MSGVEVRHLRALVAVVEEETFTDAAIRLGVTQSAVSRTIASLEQIAGVRLIERTTRSAAVTDAGRRCYSAAVTALSAWDEVMIAAQDAPRPLRLGYSWSALGRHTTGVLRRWRSECPDIPLEVHRVDDPDGGLARGSADVAVIRGGFDRAGFLARRVFDEPRVAALLVGHRLARHESVRLNDLVEDTVITSAYGTTTLDLWPAAARPTRVLRVDNTDEWLTEIAGGLAIGVTAESTATQHAHPGVVFLPVLDAEWLPVQLVWPAHRPHPATASFVDLVVRVVSGG